MIRRRAGWLAMLMLGMSATSIAASRSDDAQPIALDPSRMARVGTIDERYQSYNVEMLEVTGGKFWKPYAPTDDTPRAASSAAPAGDTPAGMNPALYAYRPPIDLTSARLRKLAGALGPAYVRVSGTWANGTYFAADDAPPEAPPPGFNAVLTGSQWRGVVDFARAVDAAIVTSFATSAGVRGPDGIWRSDTARRWLAYTTSVGGRIAAAEFMNEPTIATMGGAPPGYDAADYGRDFNVFRAFTKHEVPAMIILGPGSVGETAGDHALAYGGAPVLRTRDLLAASGSGVDGFSYHHYGAVSRRCAAMDNQTTSDAALSEEWLRRTDDTLVFYRALRDEFEPGKPLWLTETADAACGGNPWASTFIDTFRYLDQLGRLAKQNVQVVMHNTLVASDYGLLDDRTLTPKPNYWGALLWRRLMGTTVLESGVPIQAGLHVYAHCLRRNAGGVALLVINTDRARARTMAVTTPAECYTMAAPTDDLQTRTVDLNGTTLELGAADTFPRLGGKRFERGTVAFPPATITFVALPETGNDACR